MSETAADTQVHAEARQQQSQMEEIVNLPVEVKAFGKTYEIKRFTLGPATRALEYVGPFGYLLKTILSFPRDENGKVTATADQFTELAVTAVSISGPSALGLISVATNEPVEWLEDKDPFEGFAILAAILEKNLDFFSPANIERVTRMFGGLQRAILSYGGNTATTS
jgi:hypothetical protein